MEEGDDMKALLREAFGDSSSDSDGESSHDRQFRLSDSSDGISRPQLIFGDTHNWESITEIDGLWIRRNFLSADQQSSLLSDLQKEGYLGDDSRNQAMRFGDFPPWANELSDDIRENILLHGKESFLFPSELLWRKPLFDQFIVNIYQPGEGICAHVDLMRFEDGIAIISLESSCVMHFSSANEECDVPSSKIPVLLTPGSLVLMWGDARYMWKHEINRKPGFQIWQGQEINQKRRVSLTLRRLCRTE